MFYYFLYSQKKYTHKWNIIWGGGGGGGVGYVNTPTTHLFPTPSFTTPLYLFHLLFPSIIPIKFFFVNALWICICFSFIYLA